jgi:hypothetical protein
MVHFYAKNPYLGNYAEGLGMANVSILHGHLVYLMAVWYIALPLGNFVVLWYT